MELKRVAIIGAGPAGALAAILLRRQGHSVTVFEARSQIKRKICGEYLCPAGVELLQELQLPLPTDFLPVVGMRLVTPWQSELTGDFPAAPGRSSYGVSVARDRFDHWLMGAAQENGAVFKFDAQLKSMQQKGQRWYLEFQHADVNGPFDWVVGADGRQSTVARLMNWEGHRAHDFSRLALHAYLPLATPMARRGEMHLLGEGTYIGLDPVGEREVNVTLALPAAHLRRFATPLECMAHYWNNHHDVVRQLGPWPEGVKVYSIAPINHHSARLSGEGVALVGDAAGLVDPLTGEGIFNALKTAHLLAQAVAQASGREDWSTQYSASVRRLLGPKKRLNRLLQWVIKYHWPMRLLERFLRARADRPHHFIGLVGNIWTPGQALLKMIFVGERRTRQPSVGQ